MTITTKAGGRRTETDRADLTVGTAVAILNNTYCSDVELRFYTNRTQVSRMPGVLCSSDRSSVRATIDIIPRWKPLFNCAATAKRNNQTQQPPPARTPPVSCGGCMVGLKVIDGATILVQKFHTFWNNRHVPYTKSWEQQHAYDTGKTTTSKGTITNQTTTDAAATATTAALARRLLSPAQRWSLSRKLPGLPPSTRLEGPQSPE